MASETEVLDFDALYRAHRSSIVAVAAHILGDRASAEDVCQEAFTRLSQIKVEVDNPGAWLRTVAYRAAVDELRRRDRQHRLAERLEQSWREEQYPADITDDRDGPLARSMAVLSGNQRAAALMCWGDGMTPAEAAAVLGCRPATVRVHLHRARRALASALPLAAALRTEQT